MVDGQFQPQDAAPLPERIWTDALDIEFPIDWNMEAIEALLAHYGDISSLNVRCQEQSASTVCTSVASVVYYDMRSVASVLSNLCTIFPCRAQMQAKCRVVVGQVHLDPQLAKGVSNMWSNPDSEMVVIEFFDSRDALRAQAPASPGVKVACESACNAFPEDPFSFWSSSTHTSATDCCGSAPMYAGPVKEESRVCLEGLPKRVCSAAMIKAFLQQAGLKDNIVDEPQVWKRGLTGGAMVTFANEQAALTCIQHFQQCKWSGNATATLVDARGGETTVRSEPQRLDNVISCDTLKSPPGLQLPVVENIPAKISVSCEDHLFGCIPAVATEASALLTEISSFTGDDVTVSTMNLADFPQFPSAIKQNKCHDGNISVSTQSTGTMSESNSDVEFEDEDLRV